MPDINPQLFDKADLLSVHSKAHGCLEEILKTSITCV